MRTVVVPLGSRSYQVLISRGLLNDLGQHARSALGEKARHAIVVTNTTVQSLHSERAIQSLARADFKLHRFSIGDGERFKSLRTAESLLTFLIERRVERADVIVALGGGVVGDLAGFVAATYLRGIRLIQVPTTLLAQIDSSVGGKTGVNTAEGKNLIGAFHPPVAVVADPLVLVTLPDREYRAGLAEALKHGLIADREYFAWIEGNADGLVAREAAALERLVRGSVEIKADVVAEDEREGGRRAILNAGHTVAHARHGGEGALYVQLRSRRRAGRPG